MITVWAGIVVLGAIGIVVWPLLMKTGSAARRAAVEDIEFSELLAKKDSTLFAINELESDYEMGSLSQSDYQELRRKYEDKALALIKTTDQMRSRREVAGVADLDREIEQRVVSLRSAVHDNPMTPGPTVHMPQSRAHRTCPDCGADVGISDAFCSRCGSALANTCPKCAGTIGDGELFCGQCGTRLTTAVGQGGAA